MIMLSIVLLLPFFQVFAQTKAVDLSHQFRATVQEQIGGSCHVYSQTALVEAACYRALGKYLDISEGSLIEKHLVNEMEEEGKSCMKQENLARIPGYQIVSNQIDGATNNTETIKIILDGDVCLETEFPTSRPVFKRIQKVIQALDEYNTNGSFRDAAKINQTEKQKTVVAKKEIEKQILKDELKLNELKQTNAYYKNTLQILTLEYQIYNEKLKVESLQKQLDESIERRVEHQKKLKTSYQKTVYDAILRGLKKDLAKTPTETASVDLKKCLSHDLSFEVTKSPTTSQITELLDKKLPILCSGVVETIGPHQTLIVGYRRNAKGKIEFLLRDSQKAASVWGMKFSCEEILWIP